MGLSWVARHQSLSSAVPISVHSDHGAIDVVRGAFTQGSDRRRWHQATSVRVPLVGRDLSRGHARPASKHVRHMRRLPTFPRFEGSLHALHAVEDSGRVGASSRTRPAYPQPNAAPSAANRVFGLRSHNRYRCIRSSRSPSHNFNLWFPVCFTTRLESRATRQVQKLEPFLPSTARK